MIKLKKLSGRIIVVTILVLLFNNCGQGIQPTGNGVQGLGSLSNVSPTPTSTPNSSPSATPSVTPSPIGTGSSLTGLHVVMGTGGAAGHIVNSQNQIVQLHGANRAGSEWTCIWSQSFNDHTDQTTINAMKAWKINAVRIPLNEDCWLGINGVTYGGANYQKDLKTYVDLLTSNGMAVILDLHWAAPGTVQANGQLGLPDTDHSPMFWSQVATVYKGYSNVIFDLFNEPFITDWNCWLNGGAGCSKDYNGNSYDAAGMATLLKSVRDAGAQNVVIIGGLGYSSDFSQWVAKINSIPNQVNIAASWHEYSNNAQYNNYQYSCPNEWNGYSGTCPTAAQTAATANISSVMSAGYPFIIGETEVSYEGYSSLTSWWESFLTWVDGQQQSYLAWDWNTVAPPLLISNFDGTATGSGQIYKSHLQKLP